MIDHRMYGCKRDSQSTCCYGQHVPHRRGRCQNVQRIQLSSGTISSTVVLHIPCSLG